MLSNESVTAIMNGTHGDPFSVLGPHAADDGVSIRAFVHGADSVEVIEIATGERQFRPDIRFFGYSLPHRYTMQNSWRKWPNSFMEWNYLE